MKITRIGKKEEMELQKEKIREAVKLCKGNERDCICSKQKGKHSKYCNAYRWTDKIRPTRRISIFASIGVVFEKAGN
jgi:hypothetical protein